MAHRLHILGCMNDATHTNPENDMDKETAQLAINETWAAMNAAGTEDKEAARGAYMAALAAYPHDGEKTQAELDAEERQAQREAAERNARDEAQAALDKETHRRIMDGSLARETAEFDARRTAVERAMNCDGNSY